MESTSGSTDLAPSPPIPGDARHARLCTRVFQSLTVSAVRSLVSRRAAEAGLDEARSHDLVLAACEIASNSVRHAGGWGLLRVWREDDVLVCEVADRGSPIRPLTERNPPAPDQEEGYGLWIAGEVCDEVEVLDAQEGTVVRLRMRAAAVAA